MRRRLAVLVVLAPLLVSSVARGGESELSRLRAACARDFTDPLTHLRLARLHRDAGRGLLAFDIAENLRRQSPAAFRAAFPRVFAQAPPEVDDDALASLIAERASRPEDAALAERIGQQFLARGDFDQAGVYFLACAEIEPDRRRHVENMGEVLNRQGLHARAEELLAAWDERHGHRSAETVLTVQTALEAGRLPEARRLAKEALADEPDSCELLALRGQIFAAEGKPAEAERYLVQAVQLCPERARLHASLASFAMLVKGRPVEALDQYLATYFVDPNFHDGSYVDARVRALSASLADALVEERHGDCAEPACLRELLVDDNPAIVRLGLARADGAWGPELERPLLSLLGHDDPDLRAGAMLLLAGHADADFGARLEALLGSTDPRRLGMAAQLAVRLQGRAGRARARDLLVHPDELVRFDAITALAMEGGPSGRQLAAQHAEVESSPNLQELARRLGSEGS